MDIVKICLIAIVFGIIIVYLRSVNKEIASLALVAAGGVILMLAVDAFSGVFDVYRRLGDMSGISGDSIRLIIKITLICYIVEFSVSVIEDFGLKSLADKLSLLGKIVILLMATPIMENLVNVVVSIIG